MPNVLILGATGYIGRAVAHSLTSSGNYTAYGLAQTPEKAKFLSPMESHSSPGLHLRRRRLSATNPPRPNRHRRRIRRQRNRASDFQKASRERLEKAKAAGVKSPKLGLIYGSNI